MSFNIEVEGGSSVRLPTAGKYCDRDIVITATGGGSGGGAEWKKVLSYTPTSATYLTTMLFSDLYLTASYSSGIIISYGNSEPTKQGNFMGVFVYTPTEIQCFVQGAYNGSIGQYGGLKWARSGQGIGGLFGAQNVGNVRSGYVVVGATYNVYECSLPDEFAEKIMKYSAEE